MNLRVYGPQMANTYGAEAWLRTIHDFNDGNDYTINFTWGFDANAYHIDYMAIQITDGSIVQDSNYNWYYSGAPGTTNIYAKFSSGPNPDYGMVDTPPQTWSIVLNASSATAYVYDAANGGGMLLSTSSLDTHTPWYLRFITTDATSSGFPEGDDTFSLYDFRAHACGSAVPDGSASGLLLISSAVLCGLVKKLGAR